MKAINAIKAALLAAAAITPLLAASVASALELPPEEVHAGYRETGTAKDWIGIFSPGRGEEGAGRVCAAYSKPKEAAVFEGGEPVDHLRGELAAFVSWNDAEVSDAMGEVSFMLGAPVAEGAIEEHLLEVVGQRSFKLVGVGDRLYVAPEDDAAVIAAIREGAGMIVSGKLADGTMIKDTYSLMGVVMVTNLSRDGCE